MARAGWKTLARFAAGALSRRCMEMTLLGPDLFARDPRGELSSRIGTVFPRHRVLVTVPGIHGTQRGVFLEHLDQLRASQGQPPLRPEDQARELASSVDLFFEPDAVLIRPDPEHMELAFEADEFLQQFLSKRRIRFLFVLDPRVRQPLKERGECWRISALPRSPQEMQQLILDSKVAIQERAIYYYSRASGTRWLTWTEFVRLEALPAPELARQLDEIADHSRRRNRLGNPEVDFFAADPLRFNARDVADAGFGAMAEGELRARYAVLRERFRAAVDPLFLDDDPRAEVWRNRVFTTLVNLPDQTRVEEILRGLSSEFFLQIEWLPGGRIEEGEFMFDSVFEELEDHPDDDALRVLCDPKAKGFVFNFIREYGDLDYVNVGRIGRSLSQRPQNDGRRGVYIAELKPRSAPVPVVRFIRLLKWGVLEHLEDGETLLQSMLASEEYIDYVLDRRLGCRQLGMNVPPRISIRRVGEFYAGRQQDLRGQLLRTPYFERDYIRGIATDKLPSTKHTQEGYALGLGRLLGKAAASNLIVGRTYDDGERVVFDDGDEVVVEGEDGLPQELVIGDHSGAFGEYERPLVSFAKDYAQPVNRRLILVPHPRDFAEAYLASFRDWFLHMQADYRKRRRAFDKLFKHAKYDPAGSFAYRWERVLRRLDETDVTALVEAIRRYIA